MVHQTLMYVVLDNGSPRHIQAVCATAAEAAEVRRKIVKMMDAAVSARREHCSFTIHAMNATFPGCRYRLVYGRPAARPSHPLEVPPLLESRLTNTDAHSDAYLYPDELFVQRKRALAAAAQHNARQLWNCVPTEAMDWAMVVEIGEPLWLRYRSECMALRGCGWEETDLVRPVRVVHPTADEAACSQSTGNGVQRSSATRA
jgi:hypothetical protein